MRPRLALLAHDVDLYTLVRKLGLGLGLDLVHDPLGDDLLLCDLPNGRRIVIEKDGTRDGPTKPEHHRGHDNTHDESLLALLLGGVLEIHDHGDEGEDAKQHVKDDINRRDAYALIHCLRGRHAKGRHDVEEVSGRGDLLGDGEECEEDGHLQEDGKAAPKGVELVLCSKLAKLLCLALGIVRVLVLDLHHLWLQRLHSCARGSRLRHERHDQESDDDGEDDDGNTPVAAEVGKPLQYLHQEINKPVPHGFLRLSKLGDRVIAAFVKWVASQDSFKGEPQTSQGAVLANGLEGILGARRLVDARWREQRGKVLLVAPYQDEKNSLNHMASPSRPAPFLAVDATTLEKASQRLGHFVRGAFVRCLRCEQDDSCALDGKATRAGGLSKHPLAPVPIDRVAQSLRCDKGDLSQVAFVAL